MTKYDFDKMTDRSGTNSVKWEVADGELPMWIADMDFEVCPQIVQAMQQRLDKPVFGYNTLPQSWYDAYIHHWHKHHGWKMQSDWLTFSTGVVPTISSVVRRLTLPAEKVVLQTPVYNIFFNSVVNNGRYVLESPLLYKDGKYEIDFADLEEKLSDKQTTLMILCNPHNPIGKIWDKETLRKIGELCHKHNVVVLSDEIHCDVVLPDCHYVPFASVSDICKEISVTCLSPTKAFNIAGLQTSAVCVPNPVLRHKVWRGINNDEIAEPNTFAVQAAVAAFTKGEEWLQQMNQYIAKNRAFATEFLHKFLPDLKVVKANATYLMWVDCTSICDDSVAFARHIRASTGLLVCDGLEYGRTGEGFLRINLACPKQRLQDGLNRLKTATESWKK